jgi:hypothetical protein
MMSARSDNLPNDYATTAAYTLDLCLSLVSTLQTQLDFKIPGRESHRLVTQNNICKRRTSVAPLYQSFPLASPHLTGPHGAIDTRCVVKSDRFFCRQTGA